MALASDKPVDDMESKCHTRYFANIYANQTHICQAAIMVMSNCSFEILIKSLYQIWNLQNHRIAVWYQYIKPSPLAWMLLSTFDYFKQSHYYLGSNKIFLPLPLPSPKQEPYFATPHWCPYDCGFIFAACLLNSSLLFQCAYAWNSAYH